MGRRTIKRRTRRSTVERSLRQRRRSGQARKSPVQRHPDNHRGDEQRDTSVEEAKVGDRRPWTQAHQAPADPEDERTDDEARIDRTCARQVERLARETCSPPRGEPETRKGGHDRSAHDEGERGVPGASKIEEGENLGRVGHAGEEEAHSEQEPDQEGRDALHRAVLAEDMTDKEDSEKPGGHERERRGERTGRESREAANAVTAGAARAGPGPKSDNQ